MSTFHQRRLLTIGARFVRSAVPGARRLRGKLRDEAQGLQKGGSLIPQ
jgi:hypothetical protein